MTVSATPANMRKFQDIGYRVFAWSPATNEEFSADPGDYFMLDENTPLFDAEGGECVLVVRISQVLDVDLLDRL